MRCATLETGDNAGHSPHRKLRAALAAATFLACAGPALAGPDPCFFNSMLASCWGDQSDGITAGFDIPTSTTSLFVGSSGTIMPPADTHGIFGIFDSNLSLFSNTDIVTSGAGEAISVEAPGALNIFSRGDLWSGRRGIYAFSYTDLVNVRSQGNIHAGEDGIFAQGNGQVSVDSKGTIDAAFKGIFANSFSNGVTVKSKRRYQLPILTRSGHRATAMSASTVSGSAQYEYARGIFANSFSGGVTVTSHGDIESALDNIWAQGMAMSRCGASATSCAATRLPKGAESSPIPSMAA
jgi:hypothetical protein